MSKSIAEQLQSLGLSESATATKKNKKTRKVGPKLNSNRIIKCRFCGESVSAKRYAKHVGKVHPENTKAKILERGYAIFPPSCAECGEIIFGSKKKHKRRHVNKLKKAQELTKTTKQVEPKKLTKEEARQQLEAINDQHLVQDRVIKSYLERVPGKEKLGKFGLPQDKYRYGFYGHASMCYDSWGRLNKIK